jgi:hypothetical protein
LSTFALAATLASLPACYSYVPTQPSQPEPGSDVRAHLTSEGAQQLVPRFGPGVTELGGMLLNQESNGVSMLISWYRSTRVGDIVSGDNEAVRLPFEQIAGMERKQLSKGRSLLLGAAFIGGAILAQQLISDNDRVLTDDDDEDPDPPQLVVPWGRLLKALR